MKLISQTLLLLGLLLTSCASEIKIGFIPDSKTAAEDFSRQTKKIEAESPLQTATIRPTPAHPLIPSDTAEISPPQKHFQSPTLGIQFDYPESWFVQETAPALPIAVIAASFDPANPPHKLEWSDQTTRIQFRLIPAGTVPPALDDWFESTKNAAVSNQLSIFAEERFQIANQPAALISFVSGSGGTLHQVLTIQDSRYYEINIEGNLELAKPILNTFQAILSGDLKPPDSDTPAAGICAEPDEDPISISLGTGPDGLPKAGRCIMINPTQHILFVNQSDSPFHYKLPGLTIDLPIGQQLLLDKTAGSYFGAGVHIIPLGPEIWIKGPGSVSVPTQVATMPGPLRSYDNFDLGYALTLPPGWNVDENGLHGTNHEVVFYPGDAEPFIVYLSISQDSRSIEEIANSYAQDVPDAVKDDVVFNGLPGIKFTHGMRMDFYIPYQDRILLITTDKPEDGSVQLILMSIRFQ